MPAEIERKFLVRDDSWRQQAGPGNPYRQGYFGGTRRASIRVRISGDEGRLNIKSMTLGVERQEYEYPVPVDEAREMLDTLCERPFVEKVRYEVPVGDHVWEVDVFEGDNAGLVVAEVELNDPDEGFEMPAWAGEEVSHDPKYYNINLVKHPYRAWK
ncbi:adenylate cyclase [Alkalispirillum mobile]|uniref:Adenylate cyclase n=1 Tax=Alkalispirillum mobile TaxID=85925 RepID=A0A498C423_9GAMM|nr:CYTH domain-containing protein [Alkalispirillum mobile]RLK50292.1 adenylate cyclase [Alkalispirillum mobile]